MAQLRKNMSDKEIAELISQLRGEKKYDEAYIGFFQYGGGPDESFIRANRQGLELLAAELLAAALETETEFEAGKEKTYGLDQDLINDDSEYGFSYVELKKGSRNDIKPYSEYEETWKDKAFKIGCFAIGILIVGLLIIGFITTVKWIA